MDWYSWLSKTRLESSLVYRYSLVFGQNELQAEDISYFNHEFLQSMGISIAKHRLEILKLTGKQVRGSSSSLSRLATAMHKTKRLLSKNLGKLVFHTESTPTVLPEMIPCRAHWTSGLRKQGLLKEYKQEKAMITRSIWNNLPTIQQQSTILDGTTPRSTMRSGPLDNRWFLDGVTVDGKSLSASGPLDGVAQERLMGTGTGRSPRVPSIPDQEKARERWGIPNSSPRVSGPLDGRGMSPKVWSNGSKESMNKEYHEDYQSLWSLMFQDLKPT